MSTLLFYDNPIALNSKTHLNLRIKPTDDGLKFSGKTNSVLPAGIGFPEHAAFSIVSPDSGNPVLPISFSSATRKPFVGRRRTMKGEYRAGPSAAIRSSLRRGGRQTAGLHRRVLCGFRRNLLQALSTPGRTDRPPEIDTGVPEPTQNYRRTEGFLQPAEFDLDRVSAKGDLPGGEAIR